MMRISTHILDTSRGVPVAGIKVSLFFAEHLMHTATTDPDGRCNNLLQPGQGLVAGAICRLNFDIGDYFEDGFYPEVNVTFQLSNGATHCHVPLLISPFGYTTYRGS